MNLGIGLLSEDRQHHGLIVDWAIGDNITLPIISDLAVNGFLRQKEEDKLARDLAETLNVKTPSIFNLASSLSGGNQQKVVVAKLLASQLKIIILDEPTKGVDIGAKTQMYEIISNLANQGYAVIFVSSEMPEILSMSDRIMVMADGYVTAILDNEATQEQILACCMSKEKKEA
jgi:rhamnose transport system ATP-binding protein